MFGKKKNLLLTGTPAQAVVLDAERHGGQITSQGAAPVSYRLQLRVRLADGTTFDAACTVGGHLHSAHTFYSPGDIVPVRFDPEHPDTVLVDEPALLAAREDQRRADAQAAVERAERRLAGLPDLPAGHDLPTDAALRAAHDRWKTAAARAKAAKAEHKRAQAGEDKRETLRAFNTSVKRAAEEKTARERYQELHMLRPEWDPETV
jgi:hypothetical protein